MSVIVIRYKHGGGRTPTILLMDVIVIASLCMLLQHKTAYTMTRKNCIILLYVVAIQKKVACPVLTCQ